MLAKLRGEVKKALTPIAKKLNKVDPSIVTLGNLIFSFLAFLLIINKSFLEGLIALVLASFMDLLDGAVAKINNKRTFLGNYLDAATDKLGEFLVFLSFMVIGFYVEAFLAFGFSILVSYYKARAEMVKPLNNMDWPGLGERSERLIIVMIGLAIATLSPQIAKEALSLSLYGVAGIAIIGVVQRFAFALDYLSKEDRKEKNKKKKKGTKSNV